MRARTHTHARTRTHKHTRSHTQERTQESGFAHIRAQASAHARTGARAGARTRCRGKAPPQPSRARRHLAHVACRCNGVQYGVQHATCNICRAACSILACNAHHATVQQTTPDGVATRDSVRCNTRQCALQHAAMCVATRDSVRCSTRTRGNGGGQDRPADDRCRERRRVRRCAAEAPHSPAAVNRAQGPPLCDGRYARGTKLGTRGVLKGCSRGTRGGLEGYSRGTQGVLEGDSRDTRGVTQVARRCGVRL
jgi:hypothetical protein